MSQSCATPRSVRQVGLLCALLLAWAGCDDKAKLAEVVRVEGPTHIERGAEVKRAEAGAGLRGNDVVVTGENATASVRYLDGYEIEVAEGTRFRLGAQGERLTLTLEGGSIRSKAPSHLRAAGLTIITSDGEAEVMQGSELRFVLKDGKVEVGVVYGEARLTPKGGKPQSLLAGQSMQFQLHGAPAPAEVAAAVDAGTPEPLPVTPPQLVLVSELGTPLWKKKGDRKFSKVPKEPVPAEEGTQFDAGKAARLRLDGPGLRVGLTSGAFGGLGAVTSDGARERYELTLDRGEARFDFDAGAERTVLLTSKKKRLEFVATDDAVAIARVGKNGPEVEVRTGAVTLALDGKTTTVKAGEVLELVGKVMKTKPLRRPSLVLPSGRRVRVFTEGLGAVGLDLPNDALPARLEVAKDSSFSQMVLAGTVFTERVLVDAPEQGELHWRLVKDGAEPKSLGQARFEPDKGRSVLDLDAPRADVAETGLKASVYYQSALPAITFSYPAREGTKSYRVRVYRQGEKEPVAERVVDDVKCSFEAGKLGEGQYVWYAAPLDGTGAELAGGRMNKLEIQYDNSRKHLAILKPRPNERAKGGSIRAEGIAPLGSKLFVNGKSAPLDEKGRFGVDVARADSLVFRVVGEGSEAYWVRELGGKR